ncbi:MAG: hypothetical protein CM15mP74_25500 [Halieaceae bacterium]|nr:MAG: hypothetical protein CM15mP74_25500 [Halieaceae bacterium]
MGGFTLDDDFDSQMIAAVEQFNGYAVSGKDPDFGRGDQPYDVAWHRLWGLFNYTEAHSETLTPTPRCTRWPPDPITRLSSPRGLLDTNGGPMTDAHARIVDEADQPFPRSVRCG